MKELNTKIGVFLTTYTKKEVDDRVELCLEKNDSDGCIIFMDEIRSFNPKSEHYITEEEAIELTGLEKKKSKKNPDNLYTNYNGNPLGLGITDAVLYYKDPILSLKSAFEFGTKDFNFDADFFHINIVQ